MFFIEELDNLRIYKRKFLLPLDDKNKRKNSVAMLMGTEYDSSNDIMNHPLMISKYYSSYYTERAVLYYINQEGELQLADDSDIINETIENIIDSKNRKIYFNGYSNEIHNVSKYFNFNEVDRLTAEYNVKLKYPIFVSIIGSAGAKHCTENKVFLLSESAYDKSLLRYDMYIYYNIIQLLLANTKLNPESNMGEALSLYESGLYELHKDNWIFKHNLKSLCKAIDIYVIKHGHKDMARTIINKPIDISKDTLINIVGTDIKNIFGVKEECKLPKYADNKLLPMNESNLMYLPIDEDASYNNILKRDLYGDRFKTTEELKAHYNRVKDRNPAIKYTYNILDMYKGLNLFMDFSHYNMSFIKNNTFSRVRGYNVFFELMTRLITDTRFDEIGYTKKSVLIPISHWDIDSTKKLWMANESLNPISCIYYTMVNNPAKLKDIFKDITFIFLGIHGYFKIDFSTADIRTLSQLFIRNIKLLRNNDYMPDDDDNIKDSSPKAITLDLIDKVEKSQGLEINNISTDTQEPNKNASKQNNTKSDHNPDDKKKLVDTISKAASISNSSDDAIENLDTNDELKTILSNLSANADEKSNISNARASRMIKLQNDIMDKQFKDKPLRDLMTTKYDSAPLVSRAVPVDSINEEWKDLKFQSQDEIYDMDSDIVRMFNSLSDKSHPLAVRDITCVDNSTSEDATMLYTVSYESDSGKRFSIKLDIPIWIDNKYLVLRGNKKDIPNQLFLMPIIKTDTDTVQIVSNYNKIFVKRFGTTSGKSIPTCDKIIKTISKNQFNSLKVEAGDNTKICNRHELPIDYIDMASVYNKLSTPTMTIYFNQDELYNLHKDKIDTSKGIPIGIQNNNILYYNSIGSDGKFISFSYYLLLLLDTDKDLSKESFYNAYKATPRSIRYTYSRASILSCNIPLALVCAYSVGLTSMLKKANIKYRIEKDKKSMNIDSEDFIRFDDAYLIYELDYASSLLLNGLKACHIEDYSIGEMDSKSMYLDFLDNFGGRIKADGLDNFYDLMIDKPITHNTLEYYNLPTDYIDVLIYANRLLADNKFVRHSELANNRRTRRQEQIPAILYGVLARAYGRYCTDLKHGKSVPMSMKQSAVVDEVLSNSTTSDKSIINALNEFEAYAAITPKGPCGMNSDRSYTLDKRSFDASMLNVFAMSTGFAGNVGITRQTTIDANISTARGYIKSGDDVLHEFSPTKSLCMTEALTPFGCTRDDPFRTAMTFIQTSKHGMRCKRSNPSVISSGADEALPYLVSNIFAYKAKSDGVVRSIDEKRIIIEYKDLSYDYIDLTEKVEKNSSSGMYVTLKLDSDLKEGRIIKKNDILAYDKSSFSTENGTTDNPAYCIGTFCKFALLNTDEGFEDSSIISHDLSDAMTSDIVIKKDIVLPKNTNIYNMVNKGDAIEEGDTLLLTQASYDEEDVNTLLRNLTGDEDDITELGRIPIKSKITGIIQDIKIYRTVEIDELSPSLKKIVNKYERSIRERKKEMDAYGVEHADIELGSTGKLPATGKLKNADDGVLIEIFLKYEDKMSVGDKLIYYSANKGVIKDIFPVGKEPTSDYRKNEKIHSLLATGSVNGRMVCSIMVYGGIGKGIVELSRHTKDILGIKYKDNLYE